jgi:hypothetical protein
LSGRGTEINGMAGNQINISGLGSGIYFLELVSDSNTGRFQFTKQ